jgi:leucyl aminopeptidase
MPEHKGDFMTLADTALQLHLTSGSEALRGQPIDVCEGVLAALEATPEGLRLSVALPNDGPFASNAERRWLVDRAVRRSTGLYGSGPTNITAHQDVHDSTVYTIALDQYSRTKGRVEVMGRPNVERALRILGPAEHLVRTWVNEDATVRTSLSIAADVQAFAQAHAGGGKGRVTCEILDTEALRKAGLNLLVAVGQASTISPPRLVIARYEPAVASHAKALALVGKGITFDSGGINVKPYESFVSAMRNDMAGAATAFGVFKTLVEQGTPRPLWLVIPTCENPIGEGAMRPGTVVRSHRGLDVVVDHTDAEGRLILADALSYVSSCKQPPIEAWCFATLTTAALISYGPYATPVHFADAALESTLRAASETTGEDLHFFPTRVWHREANRDKWADLRNTARLPGDAVRAAGSRNAAHFLRFFTDMPLVHWDIFASCWNWSGEAPGAGFGATGAPVRTVLQAFGVGI